jgi:hypothetical protein
MRLTICRTRLECKRKSAEAGLHYFFLASLDELSFRGRMFAPATSNRRSALAVSEDLRTTRGHGLRIEGCPR